MNDSDDSRAEQTELERTEQETPARRRRPRRSPKPVSDPSQASAPGEESSATDVDDPGPNKSERPGPDEERTARERTAQPAPHEENAPQPTLGLDDEDDTERAVAN